ncbi:MAG: hypothetical protein AAF206_16940 [Bacteroidota bacterium]
MVYRIKNYWEDIVPLNTVEDFHQWHKSVGHRYQPGSLLITGIDGKVGTSSWGNFPTESINRPDYQVKDPITGLPDQFGQFRTLRKLGVKQLGLTKLPASISALKHVWMLDISFNRISLAEAKPIFQKMKSLKVLRVYGCDWDIETIDYLENELGIEVRYTLEQHNEDIGWDRTSRSWLLRY